MSANKHAAKIARRPLLVGVSINILNLHHHHHHQRHHLHHRRRRRRSSSTTIATDTKARARARVSGAIWPRR